MTTTYPPTRTPWVYPPGDTGLMYPPPPQGWNQPPPQGWNQPYGWAPPPPRPPSRWARWKKALKWVGTTAVVVALLAGGIWVTASVSHRDSHTTAVSTPTTAVIPPAPTGFTGAQLDQLLDSIGKPCPGAHSQSNEPPPGVVGNYWPQEADVKAKLRTISTPNSDIRKVEDEIRQLKLELWGTWLGLRVEAHDLRLDPTDDTIEDQMKWEAAQFDDALKRHLGALSSGNLPSAPDPLFEESMRKLVCGK